MQLNILVNKLHFLIIINEHSIQKKKYLTLIIKPVRSLQIFITLLKALRLHNTHYLLECNRTSPGLSAIFIKIDNFCDFLFAFLDDETDLLLTLKVSITTAADDIPLLSETCPLLLFQLFVLKCNET